MEAVVWLEDYLSKWTKLLFMVCHSQDFLNNVCTHIVHLDHNFKTLSYYKVWKQGGWAFIHSGCGLCGCSCIDLNLPLCVVL